MSSLKESGITQISQVHARCVGRLLREYEAAKTRVDFAPGGAGALAAEFDVG